MPVNYLITSTSTASSRSSTSSAASGSTSTAATTTSNDGTGVDELRQHQPPARLPAADGAARARVRPLPPHRLRLPPARAPAAVRARVQGAGRAGLRLARPAGDRLGRSRTTSRSAAKRLQRAGPCSQYALLAATLPGGHLFQVKIDGVTGYAELTRADRADPEGRPAVREPRRRACRRSRTTPALGRKPTKTKAPTPQETTVTVLNGNGVAGSAASASYLLAQRGYITLLPPGNAEPNAPNQTYFHSQIYFDPTQNGRQGRRRVALEKLVEPADVQPLPKDPALRALDPGAMLLFVAGPDVPQHDQHAADASRSPKRQPPNVRSDAAPGGELLEQYRGKVPFKLMVPTILESSSYPDPAYGDTPSRLYKINERPQGGPARLPHRRRTSTGASRRPTGTTRPCSPTGASGTGSRAATTTSTTRASTCTWSCCAAGGATYWVVEHAARLALERDDDRDRQGPQAARGRPSRVAARWRGSASSARAGSASSPGPASPSSATRS